MWCLVRRSVYTGQPNVVAEMTVCALAAHPICVSKIYTSSVSCPPRSHVPIPGGEPAPPCTLHLPRFLRTGMPARAADGGGAARARAHFHNEKGETDSLTDETIVIAYPIPPGSIGQRAPECKASSASVDGTEEIKIGPQMIGMIEKSATLARPAEAAAGAQDNDGRDMMTVDKTPPPTPPPTPHLIAYHNPAR